MKLLCACPQQTSLHDDGEIFENMIERIEKEMDQERIANTESNVLCEGGKVQESQISFLFLSLSSIPHSSKSTFTLHSKKTSVSQLIPQLSSHLLSSSSLPRKHQELKISVCKSSTKKYIYSSI